MYCKEEPMYVIEKFTWWIPKYMRNSWWTPKLANLLGGLLWDGIHDGLHY